jgi:bacillithiol system protein YtxJ
VNWIALTSEQDFLQKLDQGKNDPAFVFAVFKHSTRCSISSAALDRMERKWEQFFPEVPVLFLDLLANRSLSNQIANLSNVRHESPQLLVFKQGKCIGNWSHFEIAPDRIQW